MDSPIERLKSSAQKREIASKAWRGICLGEGEGSDHTWGLYRAQVGLISATGKPTRQRDFSRYHAILLLVRSRATAIAKELGVKLDKKLPALDVFDLEALADQWMLQYEGTDRLPAFEDIKGSQLQEVLRAVTGKPPSERTLYRLGGKAGIPKYSRRKRYTKRQIVLILKAVT